MKIRYNIIFYILLFCITLESISNYNSRNNFTEFCITDFNPLLLKPSCTSVAEALAAQIYLHQQYSLSEKHYFSYL